MLKPKAPKDMTATEFVVHLKQIAKKEFLGNDISNWGITIREIDAIMEEPAPNPFTPDQIAWMREEQRSGMKYAAIDEDGDVCCFSCIPEKGSCFWSDGGNSAVYRSGNFLSKFLSWDDPEPLRFADFAPLEVTK